MTNPVQTIRNALRVLSRAPGHSLSVVLTLALGIGATTAIFSVFHAVVLKPLPYPEPERLVSLWESIPERNVSHNVVSSGNFMDWRERNEVFESMAAYSGLFPVTMTGSGTPERVTVTSVTPSLFETLGIPPKLGAVTDARAPAEGNRVFISQAFWQSHFAADPDVVGSTVRLDDQSATIAGVMPSEFAFPGPDVQMWLPRVLDEEDRQSRKAHQWKVVARLAPGVTVDRARAHMTGLADAIREEYPAHMEGFGVNVFPLHGDIVGNYSTTVTGGGGVSETLRIVMGVVGLTLLIACANVAGLLLARQARLRHELAIRKALGASRARLVAGVFAECALFTVIGSAAGLVLAWVGLELLLALGPADIPRLGEAAVNTPVLVFACLLALVTTVSVGLLPAALASREDPAQALTGGARTGGGRSHAWRRAIIVTEVALACVLTVGAGLLTHSMLKLANTDPGYRTTGLQLVGVPLPRSRYPESVDQTRVHERVIESLRALPGVSAVSGTAEPPVIGYQMTFSYVVEGRRIQGANEFENAQPVRAVTPDYFRTLGQPLLSGRSFTDADRADSLPVALVNQTFAQHHWPGESAVGKRLSFDGHDGPWVQVVGVVGDTRHNGLDRPESPVIYLPYAQKRWDWMTWMYYLIRSEPGSSVAAGAVREAVWDVDPQVALGTLRELDVVYAESNARVRFATVLLAGFATLALVLSVIGIYGVLAYSVAQRRQEFGVRMAVGADRPAILRLVLGTGLGMTVVGLVLGMVLAVLFARTLSGLLIGVSALDPVTFTVIPVLILATAVLASLLPGLHAVRTSPVDALRHE